MQALDSLMDVADQFDAIVLDQWGVLHDGTTPYPGAVDALHALRSTGKPLAVLSNSGKRASPNADRITAMGFPADAFHTVMTSGEALWQDIAAGRVPHSRFTAITRDEGDAERWAEGLSITLTDTDPDAVLLMGLPDAGADHSLSDLPVYCTNPDRASPRAGGATVVSPGALAHAHKDAGGDVTFYGKPHAPIFRAVEAALGTTNLLMVGDSLEHDIAGGHGAGWSTAFIRGGLHASAFTGDDDATIRDLAASENAPLPTFHLAHLG
ncbi:TIGR01459 family HAD-type hydrolase [Gymnodinialimonas hymeniacidonis]|uniref:TIGR01459 family HAD-type hydrolase n=1 Tax=Gymnodinialimonas hymeniacidonis TaxID=3126508 RepID=UPI0034C68C2A